jgi:signal peptidase I
MAAISMEPTIRNGEFITIDAFAHLFRSTSHNELVAFANNYTKGKIWVFRVVGLPQETASINNGHVFINDAPLVLPNHLLTNDYSKPNGISGKFTVPGDYYFLLGDNPEFSNDSRFMGAVSKHAGIGFARLASP